METSELKPCPFCGGEAWATADSAHSTAFYVGCDTDHCFGSLMWAENLTEAVQCWNTRTPDLAAEVLRLREAGAYLLRVVDHLKIDRRYEFYDVFLMVKEGSSIASIEDARAALKGTE